MHKGSYSTHHVSTMVPKADGSSDRTDVELFLERFAPGIRPILDEGFHMKPLDVVAESRRSFRIQRLDILRGRLTQLARPKGN